MAAVQKRESYYASKELKDASYDIVPVAVKQSEKAFPYASDNLKTILRSSIALATRLLQTRPQKNGVNNRAVFMAAIGE